MTDYVTVSEVEKTAYILKRADRLSIQLVEDGTQVHFITGNLYKVLSYPGDNMIDCINCYVVTKQNQNDVYVKPRRMEIKPEGSENNEIFLMFTGQYIEKEADETKQYDGFARSKHLLEFINGGSTGFITASDLYYLGIDIANF